MFTDINTEGRLIQARIAAHLEKVLGSASVDGPNHETIVPDDRMGRDGVRNGVPERDLLPRLMSGEVAV